MMLNLPMNGPTRYGTADLARQFFERVESAVKQVPGVSSAAVGGALPLDGMWFGQIFAIDGDPPNPDGQPHSGGVPDHQPHVLSDAGHPGRERPRLCRRPTRAVASRCASSARHSCGGSSATAIRSVCGCPFRESRSGAAAPVVREIVGVARQVKTFPGEREPVPQIYVPLAQNTWFMASISVRPATGSAEALAAGCACGDCTRRQGPPGLAREDHRHRRLPGQRETTVPRRAGRHVRDAGPRAGDGRCLRRARLLRPAAHAGVRRPRRDGRPRARRAAPGPDAAQRD